MAIQSRNLGLLVDDVNGQTATLRIEYDDAQLRLTLVEIVNLTTFPVHVVARRNTGTGPTYTLNAAPGETVSQAIPGAAQNRIGLSIDERGRVDGATWSFGYGVA